jgi:FkbM family methyltransferase
MNNIKLIAEHSVDLDLLPEKATILDAGCRGFEFTDYFQKRGHTVFSCDIDDLKDRSNYIKMAISDSNGKCSVNHTADAQGKHIVQGTDIHKVTTEEMAKRLSVSRWDLIKLDIEGEEYNVLNNAENHPIASQVSVEFHSHCRPEQTKAVLDKLLDKLAEFYFIKNRNWESKHGAGFNYWDVLLIAK